ncbi:MAG TPA: UDP-N-acetylmuramoyl-tripeptide--D-alanyl-D-alanine ligase [Candidatus Cloacimonetes bacterium]|nr:UDP-N-acetylmuramoyl-tripeptide--D-alanyl-D-alanine ligase [Candidatus Cloacimonadota bacterium]HHE40362.1 UDP-N-acetylmuramoyl-tripeptide--D-alanyl-D-alanine ligase [Candidatus Cloacimonadota bacterium]
MKNLKIKQIVSAINATTTATENAEINCVIHDSRKCNLHSGKKILYFAIHGDQVDGHDFVQEALLKGASFAVVDHELQDEVDPRKLLYVEDTVKALDTLGKYYLSQFDIPKIAITGSVGKTISKEFIANVLSQKYKVHRSTGNLNTIIGLPITIFDIDYTHEIAVLELGTNHFGEIKALTEMVNPDIAIITNIGPSHLEFLENLEGVFKEKQEIFKYSQNQTLKIFNGNISFLQNNKGHQNYFSYGFDDDNNLIVRNIARIDHKYSFYVNDEKYFIFNDVYHNVLNAIPAIIIGKHFGLSHKQIQQGLAIMPEVGLRMEIRSNTDKNWTIIADCYNANPVSMISALNYLQSLPHKNKIVILGDMLELGDESRSYHEDIGILVRDMNLRRSIAIGEMARFYKFITHYSSAEDFIDHFSDEMFPEDAAILIKASRGIALEKIAERLAT